MYQADDRSQVLRTPDAATYCRAPLRIGELPEDIV